MAAAGRGDLPVAAVDAISDTVAGALAGRPQQTQQREKRAKAQRARAAARSALAKDRAAKVALAEQGVALLAAVCTLPLVVCALVWKFSGQASARAELTGTADACAEASSAGLAEPLLTKCAAKGTGLVKDSTSPEHSAAPEVEKSSSTSSAHVASGSTQPSDGGSDVDAISEADWAPLPVTHLGPTARRGSDSSSAGDEPSWTLA